ncbi:MAG: hypothetical protein KAI17_17700 [Thiotrichaceae bacterium]|nr:hypothetical protein [Thiotrichaceae bacterium]
MFISYSETALAHEDIQGGKGLFRESAHRLEKMIKQHYVPDLDRNILQLRRHEKDYLLRGDNKYVETASQMIQKIQNQVMVDMIHKINSSSSERVSIMLWIVFIAVVLGIYFAVTITRNIAKPLVKMATMLEDLTVTELIQPMPFQKDGRDEVNAMAGSLNILADNRKHFINWWKNSMSETEAYTQLDNILQQLSLQSEQDEQSISELKQIKTELAEILDEKKILLSEEFKDIRIFNEEILKQAAQLNHTSIAQDVVFEVSHTITYTSELMKNNLDMLSYKI